MERMEGRKYQPVQQFAPAITYEDFYPTYDWAQDSDGHILLIDLPGFVKEDVRVQLDNFGNVTVGGGRRVGESRYRRFMQVFNIPGDANFESISARFDNGLLYIIMPKVVDPIKQQQTGGPQEAGTGGKTEARERPKDDHAPRETIKEKIVGQETAEEGREKLGGDVRERKQGVGQEKIREDGRENAGAEGKREKAGWEGKEGKTEKFGQKGQRRVKFGGESAIGDERIEEIEEKGKYQESREKIDEKGTPKKGGEKTMGEEEQREKSATDEKKPEPDARERRKEEKRGEDNDLERERIHQRAEAGKRDGSGDREEENKAVDSDGIAEGTAVGRIWERIGWNHAIESRTVEGIVTNMKRNKMTVASALVALSLGLYIAQKFKSANDSM